LKSARLNSKARPSLPPLPPRCQCAHHISVKMAQPRIEARIRPISRRRRWRRTAAACGARCCRFARGRSTTARSHPSAHRDRPTISGANTPRRRPPARTRAAPVAGWSCRRTGGSIPGCRRPRQVGDFMTGTEAVTEKPLRFRQVWLFDDRNRSSDPFQLMAGLMSWLTCACLGCWQPHSVPWTRCRPRQGAGPCRRYVNRLS
jgi:hypothetical protein